jgi:hypothetical protein
MAGDATPGVGARDPGLATEGGDEDLIEENFESVEAITKYILRKKGIPVLDL